MSAEQDGLLAPGSARARPSVTDLSRTSAIAVNWHCAPDTIGLLRSLDADFAAGLRMVLVDNASADGSVEILQTFLATFEHARSVDFLETGENLGFTGGVNFAVERALQDESAPEHVLLLNPDGVVAQGAIEELLAVSQLSGAAIVSTSAPCETWPHVFYGRPRKPTSDAASRWLPAERYLGACALFQSSLIRALVAQDGYFQDAGMFMYWDEWDVSLRSRRLGARIAAAQGDYYTHHGSTRAEYAPGTSWRTYYSVRNGVLLARRELSPWKFWPLFVVRLLRDVSWRLRLMARGVRPPWRVYARGTWDGLRGKSGIWDRHPAG